MPDSYEEMIDQSNGAAASAWGDFATISWLRSFENGGPSNADNQLVGLLGWSAHLAAQWGVQLAVWNKRTGCIDSPAVH